VRQFARVDVPAVKQIGAVSLQPLAEVDGSARTLIEEDFMTDLVTIPNHAPATNSHVNYQFI